MNNNYKGIIQLYLIDYTSEDLRNLEVIRKDSKSSKNSISSQPPILPAFHLELKGKLIEPVETLFENLSTEDYNEADNSHFMFIELSCGDHIIQRELEEIGEDEFLNETITQEIVDYLAQYRNLDGTYKKGHRIHRYENLTVPSPIHIIINICYSRDDWTGEYDVDYEASIVDLNKL